MLYTLFILSLVALSVLVWFYKGGKYLPDNIESLISEVKSNPLPDLIFGELGYVQSGDISICYNVFGNKSAAAETILLVNGLTHTLLDWPPYFLDRLVACGYRIIRFDNRGVGMSDHLRGWKRESGFTLRDMATDAIAVMDYLEIENAHLIGVSMGGMISQELAIHFSERVNSLTSIMSTGFFYDPELVNEPRKFNFHIVRLYARYKKKLNIEDELVKYHLATQRVLKGAGEYDFHDMWTIQKAYYEIRNRKGFNPKAVYMQGYAIKKSGSRYDSLSKLNVPTLVIHGKDDPLIFIEHAYKYADIIPHAKTLYIDGMGHDLPLKYIDDIINAIKNQISV